MRTLCVLTVVVSCAASAWAGVGETQEEAIKRCGEPSYWGKPAATNTAQAVYFKEEPHFWITFFTNKDGRSVAGQISYQLPRELAQDKQLAEPVILKLLEANAGGHPWTEDAASERMKRLKRTYRREGATATWFGGSLTITIDEYLVFAEAERKRLAAEQAERIGESVKK